MTHPKKTPTLYLTRNGLLEPLGQSQVMAYLRGLSQDYEITLITYEKSEDWADGAAVAKAKADCAAHGINWMPQKFRPRPRVIAPALSMVRMVWLVRREVKRRGIRLMHARSYIPAAALLTVKRLTGVPFLFDMRALWPEELITAGRLKRGSMLHRAIVGVERSCLGSSAGVVSLTHAAVGHLENEYPDEMENQRIVVIPTCADLDRFQPPATPKADGPRVHSCVGTVLSGWFRTDWLAAWIKAADAQDPTALFDIITRDDPDQVRAALDPDNVFAERLTISSRAPHEMPKAIHAHDLSVMFFTEGLSKLGSSPTRMAEILGTGLPVVANAGVGDVARIIEKYNVGVLVEGPAPAQMDAAVTALNALMTDPDLAQRCRAAAVEVYSLKAGTVAYAGLYAAALEETN